MNANGYLPASDGALVAWDANFIDIVQPAPTTYGFTPSRVSAHKTLHNAYAGAVKGATDPLTRTRGAVAAKNSAKKALIADIRLMVATLDGVSGITDQQRINLGLNVRKAPAPIPAPREAPELDILAVTGTTVRCRAHGAAPSKRGKPAGVAGVAVYSYVGENPPAELSQWTAGPSSTRALFDVQFEGGAPGAKVWLMACWFNPRLQRGPMCPPAATNLQFGAMKRAA